MILVKSPLVPMFWQESPVARNSYMDALDSSNTSLPTHKKQNEHAPVLIGNEEVFPH